MDLWKMPYSFEKKAGRPSSVLLKGQYMKVQLSPQERRDARNKEQLPKKDVNTWN